jgi:hypothetical protein
VRVKWHGTCQYTAEDLLATKKGGDGKFGEAQTLLLTLLADGPMAAIRADGPCWLHGVTYRKLRRFQLRGTQITHSLTKRSPAKHADYFACPVRFPRQIGE